MRSIQSADKEIEGDQEQLVARSRDLLRNNAYARRIVTLAQNHIIGPKGVRLLPMNALANGRMRDAINDEVTAAWDDWSKPQHASANGRLSWLDIQRLMVAERIIAGDALLQIVVDAVNPYGMALHVIDADRLDRKLMREAGPGRNAIRYGIEIDGVGRPVAYHILRAHPSELGVTTRAGATDVIPAAQIIHWHKRDMRAEQTRGVPELAVAMLDLRHLAGFQEAALVKMRTAAAAMGFIITKGDGADVTTPEEGLEFHGEPGIFRELAMGQEMQSWDPKEPATSFPDFKKAILRSVASGVGVSYNQLANDLEGVNMSSMRVGRQEEQETWKSEQESFIAHVAQRVFDAWLPIAIAKGHVPSANYVVPRASRVRWQARRWQSVDPFKEAQAQEKRIQLGLDSRKRIAADEGNDLWEIWDDLAEEQEYAEEKDLDVSPDRGTSGAMTNDDTEGTDGADAAPGDDAGTDADRGRTAGGGGRGPADRHRHQLRVAG
jgi:lambda family phage portal protein